MEGSSSGGPPPLTPMEFPPLSSSLSSLPPPTTSSPFSSGILPLPKLSLPSKASASTPVAPPTSPDSSISLWKDLFNRNSDLPKTFPPPSFTTEGVPVVKAPSSILLKASESWKDYLLCHFFGSPPPLKKIFADLNPIWGKKGQIQVRSYSPRSCLILIPNLQLRKWILDVGLWSTGTVAFAVSMWTPTASLSEQKLTSAPVWLSLSGVPPQLCSLDGLAVVASGVGIPIPPANVSSASPISYSSPKTRAVVRLDKGPLPSSVIVVDDEGEQVVIGVQYIGLPPLCPTCNLYGHRSHRCPLKSRGSSSEKATVSITQPPVSSSQPAASSPAAVHQIQETISSEDKALGFSAISGPTPVEPNSPRRPIHDVPILLQKPTNPSQPFNQTPASPQATKPSSGPLLKSNSTQPNSLKFQDPTHPLHIPSYKAKSPHSLSKSLLIKALEQPNSPINVDPISPRNVATTSPEILKTTLPSAPIPTSPNPSTFASPLPSSTFTSLLRQQIEDSKSLIRLVSSTHILPEDSSLETYVTEHFRSQIKDHNRSKKKNKEQTKDFVKNLGPRFFPISK